MFGITNTVYSKSTASEEIKQNCDRYKKFRSLSLHEFYDWFVGFSDAESCFQIYLRKDRHGINFAFTIELHIDDIDVLYYIRDMLKCGTVRITHNGKSALFGITGIHDLFNILIPIFDNRSLNTTPPHQLTHLPSGR